MEDSTLVIRDLKPGVHFFGVFDGHGGDAVALYVKKYLPSLLKSSRNLAQSNYERVFEEVFKKIDTMLDSKTAVDELRTIYKHGLAGKDDNNGVDVNHAMQSGCTACCAIIT
jgi:protein phosphatase 1G